MTELPLCSHPEAVELLGPDTVVLQPIGALEAHGPHLPLDTDAVVARAVAERAAALLSAAGVRALTLPPFAYGVSRLADRFPGWISLRPGTLWALLEDVIESLTEQGVRRIVLVNAHFEPEHTAVLDGVILDHPAVTARAAQVLHPRGDEEASARPLLSSACVSRLRADAAELAADEDRALIEARAKFMVRSVREAWPELTP